MKKIKVSEASGPVLDWLVATAEGYGEAWLLRQLTNINPSTRAIPSFTTDWSQGGPIIEREHLCLRVGHDGVRLAFSMQNYNDDREFMHSGPTSLIAAMRCFVASRLGDEVEVPEELL